MKNYMSCQIKGIEKLNLLLNNSYILELSKARYMPDLQRNLIILEEFDNEYDISIHKGFTKINLNCKEIISTTKFNRIYTL